MTPEQRRNLWVWGGGLTVFTPVLAMLLAEFWRPDNMAWNMILVVLLVGIGLGAVSLAKYLAAHVGEVGEARFDTRNPESAE